MLHQYLVHVEGYHMESVHFVNRQQQNQREAIFVSLKKYLGMAKSTFAFASQTSSTDSS